MLSILPAVSAARPEASCLPTSHQRLPTAFEWRPLTNPGFRDCGDQAFAFPRPHQEPPAVVECGELNTPRILAGPWMTNHATGGNSSNGNGSSGNDSAPKMAVVGESGSLFRAPPHGLSIAPDYSPPSPRLYPPHYPSYFSPQHTASPTSTPPSPSTPYFFPFPHPNPYSPSRHFLQIDSYSLLTSIAGVPPPPRPTPIFSASPSVPSQSPQFGLYPPPLLHPSVTPFGPGPAGKSPAAVPLVPLFGSPSGLGPAGTPECTSVSPASTPSCHSPSPHCKYHELGSGSPPLSPFCFPCGKEGSLKHRFLVRPVGQGPSSIAEVSAQPAQPTQPQLTAVSEVQPSSSKRSRSSPLPEIPNNTKTKPATVLQPHYPAHFMKGSVIQLANGELRCVEELRTEDFVKSAEDSSDLQIDSSTVVKIEEKTGLGTVTLGFSVGEQRIQVCVEATLEHPFFVFGQGWSSCFPERTLQRFALSCHQLQVGDVCISLTHRQRRTRHSESSAILRPTLSTAIVSRTIPVHSARSRKRRWSASDALTVTAVNVPVEHRSNSLAEASGQ